jgi:hypothetical protein
MALSQKQQQDIKNALGAAGVQVSACTECQKTNWSLATDVFASAQVTPTTQGAADLDLQQGAVSAALVCNDCGYLKFFSLAKLNINPTNWPA